MKVVHIATMEFGGAGIAAQRIHHALLQAGVESRMLVRYKSSADNTVMEARADMGLYRPSKIPIVEKVVRALRRHGKCLTQVERYERQLVVLDRQYGAAFTLPVSNFNLAMHPLVQEADIIHLHWVENFLDYPTFFHQVKKPIVWTFHDENIAYGGFHYSDEAIRLKEPFCHLETPLREIKYEALGDTNHNIHMVALCSMMERFYRERAIAPDYPVATIHNGIVADGFRMIDRTVCREILGLPTDKRVLCFCASDINEKHKGLSTLVQAIDSLHLTDTVLLCIGAGQLPECSIPVVGTGSIANPHFLSLAYSAADLFVMPSEQEAFGQTPLEAMACGCPVVSFPCGIIDELINEANGIRCPDFTCESLSKAILSAINRHYNRDAIRCDVLTRFDIALIAQQYIDLYNRCKS